MANEKRLIDANAFRQSLELDRFGYTDIVKVNIALDKSTVDAVEVVHGSWDAVMEYEDFQYAHCSACGKRSWYMTNYCPNCGAKMDRGTE